MLRHLALRFGALAVAALIAGAPRAAMAGTTAATESVVDERCSDSGRYRTPEACDDGAFDRGVATITEAICAGRSRNPNYPAAFVFESHSSMNLAHAQTREPDASRRASPS